MSQPDLSIIIVNHNTRDLLKNCLKSIFKNSQGIKLKVIVVDNASTDDSIQMLTTTFPQVKLIRNNQNLLYSHANNQGLKITTSKYFLILNSDTIIPDGVLSKMIAFMNHHPDCGLAICREVDGRGRTIRTCHRFPTPLTQILELPFFAKLTRNSSLLRQHHYEPWDRAGIKQVDTVPGSFMLGRNDLLKTVGFLDEHLPLFYSDADYCKRVHNHHYKLYHNDNLTITHLTAQTLTQHSFYQTMSQSYRDMAAYFTKHHGPLWGIILRHLSQLHLSYLSLKNSPKFA